MSLAITEEHTELASVAKRFVNSQGKALAREATDGSVDRVGGMWSGMASQGWPGLHLDESYGGLGYGIAELGVVLAELGRVVAPVPLAATTVVSALIAQAGDDDQRSRYLPGLADGSRTAAFSLGVEAMVSTAPMRSLSGVAPAVIGGRDAHLVAVVIDEDVVLIDTGIAEVVTTATDPLDNTLGIVRLQIDGLVIDDPQVIRGAARRMRALALTLYAADALGNAEATLQASVAYAKTREQFGRPIGSFQAVKHHCANMAVKTELATAAVWDACRADVSGIDFEMAAVAGAAIAFDAAIHNAQLNIQIHGGMGFTWEHDAHIFLRRAVALAQLLGPLAALQDAVYRMSTEGIERHYAVALPPEAERFRAEVRDFADEYRKLDSRSARELAVRTGYIAPHWPVPHGRAAGPIEQLVIDQELDDLKLPNLGIGGWILQTVLQHGSAGQIQRWLGPGLMGEQVWCQLFSEPDAGSDAAAIRTRGVKVDGGWSITGLKIWTSGAEGAHRGLATVRTDAQASKRGGLTTMVLDMQAQGVSVRPLREMTGLAMFNEVFLDSVFVPDEDVLGPVGAGWEVARATLGNERVTIGGGAYRGITASELIPALSSSSYAGDRGMQRRIGALIADEHAMHLLGLRRDARALANAERGNEGNVAKLLSAEHAQRVSELAVEFHGAAVAVGDAPRVTFEYLFDRCLTIGGGTSEISRNVIAERLLGLPRDTSLN